MFLQLPCLRTIAVAVALTWAGENVGAQPASRSFLPTPTATLPTEGLRYRDHNWLTSETPNFKIFCPPDVPVVEIGRDCETLRSRLIAKWFGDSNPSVWSPKCLVVLHPSRSSYLNSVGLEAADTAGSSVVVCRAGKVVSRRVDLRGDRIDFRTAALPHELAHVVLADLFPGRSLPRWADEGMAILEDSVSKRSLHLRDLQAAWADGRLFHLRDLLQMREYPSHQNWGVFYGQSVSVVEYLVSRSDTRQFVNFLARLAKEDLDAALRETYAIADAEELDRLWRASLFVDH
jgi:hypothetical protein